jgi:hypothetical protein
MVVSVSLVLIKYSTHEPVLEEETRSSRSCAAAVDQVPGEDEVYGSVAFTTSLANVARNSSAINYGVVLEVQINRRVCRNSRVSESWRR